ncbi:MULTISPECIES: hypothetical protein [unclassified Microbacterium]|uniref:hypothetical protein n=1 Tax=unclassified Microbacterium TaxID=2609290 RepID=UPI0037463C6A
MSNLNTRDADDARADDAPPTDAFTDEVKADTVTEGVKADASSNEDEVDAGGAGTDDGPETLSDEPGDVAVVDESAG